MSISLGTNQPLPSNMPREETLERDVQEMFLWAKDVQEGKAFENIQQQIELRSMLMS